jgi:hypothetical protein
MGVPLAELTTPYAGTSLSLSANYGQGLTYSGSTGTTWTLPSITATNNGEKFEICNGATAAVTLTLAAAATQFFNNNSGKTSYALTQFTSISVRAVWGGSTATSFWHIIGNNGAT